MQGFITLAATELGCGKTLAAAVRSAARQHSAAAAAFYVGDSDAEIETQFSLRDELTFPNEPLPATLSFERQDHSLSLTLDAILARDVRSLLALCAAGRFTEAQIRSAIDEPISTLFESLLRHQIVLTGAPPPTLPVPTLRRPGVTRLQHAGLLYRGHDSGVLVDPHFHSAYEPYELAANFLRSQFEGLVDAIVISHSHGDHWHLPTLMTFPSDTLIVVPKVPRASMLCPDFEATLRAMGFTRVVALGWFDPPLTVGDLEVHAFPFYGEQPLLMEAARHPDLRNHGNTYVVRHESYTSWFLIDSGDDCTGRMADVARQVKARFGPIDLLISNLREFAILTPFYITGSGHYWLALNPDQLRRFASMASDVITLGPSGVAEICHLVAARRFLPYAHWWGALRGAPDDEERSLIAQLQANLTSLGERTEIIPWRIGDSHVP